MKSRRASQTSRSLSKFARDLRAAWKELDLPIADAVIVAAVSGGADSTALLFALDELNRSGKLHMKLVVAHLDHGLRSDSSKDAAWVRQIAKQLGYQVHVGKAQLKGRNAQKLANLEQVARTRRYHFLAETAKKSGAQFVVTGHTLDDQAETVLLRLLRGSAAEGLSGTPSIRAIKRGSNIKLARPFLSWARRSDTEDYCRKLGVDFRVDEMNHDELFTRVKVRKQLLPLMESFNKKIVEALSRTATLLGEDAEALSRHAAALLTEASTEPRNNSETKPPALNVKVLLAAPAAIRRRALRQWLGEARGDLRRLEMNHLVAVEKLLTGRGGSVIELPGGAKVRRNRQFLEVFTSKSPSTRSTPEKRLKKRAAASRISGR